MVTSSDNTSVATATAKTNGHDERLDVILNRITLVEDEVKALRSENKSIYCIIKTLADDVKALITNSASNSPDEVSPGDFIKPDETISALLKKKQKKKKRGGKKLTNDLGRGSLAKFATGVSLMSAKMKLVVGLVPIAIILSVTVGNGQVQGIIGDKTLSQPTRIRKHEKIKEDAVGVAKNPREGVGRVSSEHASPPKRGENEVSPHLMRLIQGSSSPSSSSRVDTDDPFLYYPVWNSEGLYCGNDRAGRPSVYDELGHTLFETAAECCEKWYETIVV